MSEKNEITVELPESVTKALAEVERLSTELAKLTKPEEKPEGDVTLTTEIESAQKDYARVESALSEARKSLYGELQARTEELKKSQDEIVKINGQRRRERFIKLAHALPQLPGTHADDFGELLDAIDTGLSKVDKQTANKRFAKLYQLFTSWNTVIEKGNVLMAEIGREGGDFGMLSGTEAQFEALTREKMSADPKLTHAQAYAKVLVERPELYRKYQAEQAKGGQ